MADITERIVIPEVPRVLDGQELYVYIPERKVNSYTKEETDALLATKFDKSNVAQMIGDSADKVMSQKAVTEELNNKLDKGLIPSEYLPSYVDDVLEYDSKSAFPAEGEQGIIYVDKSTNLTYRWSGSTYIQVGCGDLEAKLNENIIKNPDYTYIVVNAASLNFSMLADTVEVDWGDGTTGSQLNRGNAVNIDHTYTDGVKYHLITIKRLETVNGGWLVAIGESGIEAYIGTKTENFFNSGPDSQSYYSNLKRVIYAEGMTGITLPSMVKEPIVIPKSCEGLRVAAIDNPSSSNITIPKIIIQSNKLLERPLTLFTGFEYIGKIVVPKEYVNAYKTATGWSEYADKIVYEVDSSDLEDKVSKFTDTSSYDRAYIQNSAGSEAAINIDGSASAYSLIRRNAGGTAKVAKGVADDDIANIENLKEVNVIYVSNTLLGE